MSGQSIARNKSTTNILFILPLLLCSLSKNCGNKVEFQLEFDELWSNRGLCSRTHRASGNRGDGCLRDDSGSASKEGCHTENICSHYNNVWRTQDWGGSPCLVEIQDLHLVNSVLLLESYKIVSVELVLGCFVDKANMFSLLISVFHMFLSVPDLYTLSLRHVMMPPPTPTVHLLIGHRLRSFSSLCTSIHVKSQNILFSLSPMWIKVRVTDV